MITSLGNKTVKQLCRLHLKKYRTDQFLLLDEELIAAARKAGYLTKLVYAGELPFAFDDTLEVSQDVLDKIAGREGLSFVGVSRMIEEKRSFGRRILLLDHLQDPLNIGRIMEAAILFGFDSLILSPGCAEITNEKCLAASKGGIYELNIVHGDLLDEIASLKNQGYRIYATGLRNDTRQMHKVEPEERMAFILGNEGSGVCEEVMEAADQVMKIDMRNIDSLNVGMAAAIIMYRFRI